MEQRIRAAFLPAATMENSKLVGRGEPVGGRESLMRLWFCEIGAVWNHQPDR